MKAEALALGVKDRQTEQIGGQQIRGELYALIAKTQQGSQCMGQGGFPHAGQILDQQMAPSQQAAEGQSQLVRLAQDDLIQASQQLFIQIDHAKTPERIFIHYAHPSGYCLCPESKQHVSIGYLPSSTSGFDGCPLAIASLGSYPEDSVRN